MSQITENYFSCSDCGKRVKKLHLHRPFCPANPENHEKLRKRSINAKKTIAFCHTPRARSKMGQTIKQKHERGEYLPSKHKRYRTGAVLSLETRSKQSQSAYARHARKKALYLTSALVRYDVITPLFKESIVPSHFNHFLHAVDEHGKKEIWEMVKNPWD